MKYQVTREEEKSVLQRARAGDTGAFEALVIANQDNVYNLALRMTGSAEDALDMSQEVFLRAYRSLDGFRGDSRFSVWLYRLTSNICIDFLRKNRKASIVPLHSEDGGGEERELEIPDTRYSPEPLAMQSELREKIEDAIAALPDDYRSVIVLRELESLTYEEIAAVLELSEGTVKSRIFRARKRLMAELSDASDIVRGGNKKGGLSSNEAKGV